MTRDSTDAGAAHARLDHLDGLRAIAVGGVFVQHGLGFVHLYPGSDTYELGGLGVRLFFVLSGFLITGILLRARDRAERMGQSRAAVWRAFYLRRSLRIFPLAYLVLAIAWVLGAPSIREHPWMFLTYTSNYAVARAGFTDPSLDHFWSLAIEEQFYLLWPLLILATPKRWIPAAMGFTVALSMAARAVVLAQTGGPVPSYVSAAVLTPTRLDSLAVGGLLAWHQIRYGGARGNVLVAALLVAGAAARLSSRVLPAWSLALPLPESGYVLFSAAVVLWVYANGTSVVGRLLSSKPFVLVGTISYGLYVYHMVIAGLAPIVSARYGWPAFFPTEVGWTRLAWIVGTTFPVAAASWFWFERPLNDLKSRFPYTVGPAPLAGAQGRDAGHRGSPAVTAIRQA